MIGRKVGFIGMGNMGSALAKAMLKSQVSPSDVFVYDNSRQRLTEIKNELKVAVASSNGELAMKSDIIFLCVKPGDVNDVLNEIGMALRNKLLVSIAAGVTLASLESYTDARIIRLMPNIACLVGEMTGAYARGKSVMPEDVLMVEDLLNSAGKAFEVKEHMLDAVTALSGSGPAFFAVMVNALSEAAASHGIPIRVAEELAAQTCLGTGRLLEAMPPDKIIATVASPNGTTEAGLKVMKEMKFNEIIRKTIAVATNRAKELSNDGKKTSA